MRRRRGCVTREVLHRLGPASIANSPARRATQLLPVREGHWPKGKSAYLEGPRLEAHPHRHLTLPRSIAPLERHYVSAAGDSPGTPLCTRAGRIPPPNNSSSIGPSLELAATISPEVPCPRRPPAKSACLEGPILEAHIGTLQTALPPKKSLRLRRALALLVPRAQSISRRRSLSPFRRLIFQQSDGLPGTSSDARPAEDACDAACMQWNAHRERTAREGKGRKRNGW